MNDRDVLGVMPGATDEEVKAAFRRFVRQNHPDRGGDPARFRAGVEAYGRMREGGPSPSGATVVFHRRRAGLRRFQPRWSRRRRPARVV